jgi:putative addiction module component (TIGR02574 family)
MIMNVTVDEVLKSALELSPEDRVTLAERLLESLPEECQDEISAAWATEAERRLRAYDQGLTKGIPADEVMKSLSFDRKP